MPASRPGAAALLQKVNSQLRGERVPIVTKEEDELAVYLSGLQQKTQQVRSTNFEDHGDISISSGKDDRRSTTPQGRRSASPATPAITSKFLKKKKPTPSAERKLQDEDNNDFEENEDRGIVIAGKNKAAAPSSQSVTSAALNKAQVLAKKIQNGGTPFRRHLSRDSDTESEIGRRPTSADTSIGRDGRKFLKSRTSIDEEDVKPQTRSPSPQLSHKKNKEKSNKQRRSSKARGEIVRTLGNAYLSSEEESLAEFIHGLSASESSVRKPQNLVAKKQQKWRKTKSRQSPSPVHGSRSPSPFKRSPSPMGKLSRSLSQDSDMLDSMATDFMDDHRGRAGSVSSEDHFNINLMDVASLLPASSPSPRQNSKKSQGRKSKENRGMHRTSSNSSPQDVFKASDSKFTRSDSRENKSKSSNRKSSKKKSSLKKSESKGSLFDSLGIHMVDELLGADLGAGQNAEYALSDESEIHTEHSDSIRKREESESEIITELGAGDSRKVPIRRTVSPEKSLTISERVGENSFVQRKQRSPSESEVDDTATETWGDYSEDTFESDSRTISKSRAGRSRKMSRSKASPSEGSSRKIIMEQQHTQFATADATGATHHWQALQTGISVSGPYGLQYVDPAPVATHVISADALEAITSYSPSVLALQDMMRAQLDLVKNFVDIQSRIYQSCMEGLKENFQYTTLEDTKKYIEAHRKPRMTFKDALKLVEQEEATLA